MPGCNCEHNSHQPVDMLSSFLGLGEWGVVANLFFMAFLGSFSHCIFMCGPFAMAISQMRLMELGAQEMSQRRKIAALLSMPYYIGKAVTYALLALATYWLISFLPQVVLMKYIAFVVLVLVSCIFILLAINSSTHIGLEFRWLSNFTSVVMKRLGGGSQYGIRGFITGMVLGCIPCGMVMAALAQAVSGASSVIIVVLAMLAFGFGTIPGLLLLSFGGKQLRHGLSKKMFSVLYSIMMLYNGLMLLNYALNLIR